MFAFENSNIILDTEFVGKSMFLHLLYFAKSVGRKISRGGGDGKIQDRETRAQPEE